MTDELTPKPRGRSGQSGKPRRPPDRMARLILHAASCAIPLPIPLPIPVPDAKFPLPGGLALGS